MISLVAKESKSIYIMYGSQTGNGESLAKEFVDELIDETSCKVELCILNDAKDISFRGKTSLLIIICSTCGTGNCPENADIWWRSIKARSMPKDSFHDVPYLVLGLGDVKYKRFDSYCAMGVKIDKRLSELGGHRVLDLCYADESDNFEDTVEEWKIRVKDKIREMI